MRIEIVLAYFNSREKEVNYEPPPPDQVRHSVALCLA